MSDNLKCSLRHVEEESQKAEIVSFVSLLTNTRLPITEVVRILETMLQAAYERGFKCGGRQTNNIHAKADVVGLLGYAVSGQPTGRAI